MMPRASGSAIIPGQLRRSDAGLSSYGQSFDAVKRRVLAKLQDRLDLGASKRMPVSLLRQSLRQQAEQVTEQEGRMLPLIERERIIEDVLGELLGYGPLEELFADSTVREVMVVGPAAVIVRRDTVQWFPTSVKFRDEMHLIATLDKIAAHAEPVGPVMPSVALFDVRLPNGFRALAIIPPEALGQPATISFLREPNVSLPPLVKEPAGSNPNLSISGSTSAAARLGGPGSITASPRPGSERTLAPTARPSPLESPMSGDPLAKHRQRVLERLTAKMAALKIFDLTKVEIAELRKVVAAYIVEYCEFEKIYLSDPDQGRLMLQILTAMGR
jgi:pilus assembly protein CpaF